ncbi:NAD-dependent epimerase [Alteribacter lacisalsi]|uniref:NAD-dependent epimerase n=1 Tax=Alteribacter lacisalsi TaxID=2045244 RepID=A0A2W0HQZ9_9BACI|nr:NAD-dependent epimerase/dehydratase family protein [Alteribacter lacisalsi]PYZ96008.1 NAD-dependent epimerase [Alteribacter lacisalsi]
MKKVLVTGEKSYIANKFKQWTLNSEEIQLTKMSVRGDSWKKQDFSQYDAVLHLAGIAHVSSDPKMKDRYYQVNRDLTVNIAAKAKNEGVKQFIFMSSIIVYGQGKSFSEVITNETEPSPSDFYGDSKLQAEKGLTRLEDKAFKVAIVRPPMIYGAGSKGNYPRLSKAARKLPVFPNIQNQRSMLYVDNLCEFIKLIILNEDKGLFFPQNREFVKTSQLVNLIAASHGKKIKLTKVFNPILLPLRGKVGIFAKVFGDFVYDQKMSTYKDDYQIRTLKESVELTEKK